MRDVVFTFWRETWVDAVDRQFMTPDRFVQGLIEHPAVGRLLIANPYRRFGGATLKHLRKDAPARAPLPRRDRGIALVSPVRLQRHDGVGPQTLRRTYRRYDEALRRAAERMGMRNPAVITTNPFYAAYGRFDWAGPVTYYAFDDWSAYDAHAKWWPDYDWAYACIREQGHRVCAVSRHLLDRIDPRAGLVTPNGIVPQEWRAPCAAPAWLASLPRPHILYTGAIHGRLDLDAVKAIAARYSHGSILFVGPISDQGVADALRSIPGVELRPPLHRSEIAGLTAAADVCIMPHRRNRLTESMSPLKIYEYCAAGRPSVATDIPPVRGIHDHVVLVPEGDSFVDGIERALSLGPMPEAERQAFLAHHSWARRHDDILDFSLADADGDISPTPYPRTGE
jgi:glycosyltransferase involved in cell wall biosynthesis